MRCEITVFVIQNQANHFASNFTDERTALKSAYAPNVADTCLCVTARLGGATAGTGTGINNPYASSAVLLPQHRGAGRRCRRSVFCNLCGNGRAAPKHAQAKLAQHEAFA